jgi:hypothetical protein
MSVHTLEILNLFALPVQWTANGYSYNIYVLPARSTCVYPLWLLFGISIVSGEHS